MSHTRIAPQSPSLACAPAGAAGAPSKSRSSAVSAPARSSWRTSPQRRSSPPAHIGDAAPACVGAVARGRTAGLARPTPARAGGGRREKGPSSPPALGPVRAAATTAQARPAQRRPGGGVVQGPITGLHRRRRPGPLRALWAAPRLTPRLGNWTQSHPSQTQPTPARTMGGDGPPPPTPGTGAHHTYFERFMNAWKTPRVFHACPSAALLSALKTSGVFHACPGAALM